MPPFRRLHRRSLLVPASALAAAVLGSGAGCTTDEVLAQAKIPGTSTNATFTEVTERFGYLDATIETGGYTLRFFLPPDEACTAIAREGGEARYKTLGPLGRLTRDDLRCDPLGILSLRAWRDRRPRGAQPRSTIPRAQATFEVLDRDEELVLLNGRFPLAGEVGWVGGVATRALVPTAPVCEKPVESGVASMEYRASGRRPFALVGSDGLCDIVGFVYERPPTPAPETAPDTPDP